MVRLPSWDAVRADPVLYAHASRTLHLETNPGNARCLVQKNGDHDVWLNPPPLPLTTEEMDRLYELPYARRPHPRYGDSPIPAYQMIRFSVTIQRGCFGGCSFCSITEHEGRVIQSRSEGSILKEIETIRDRVPGFTGVISDLGGPTANMYRLACRSPAIEEKCRRLSCVYPRVCENLNTDHSSLVELYRKARAVPGVKRITIGSGLRYDLAVRSPEYVRELVTHHVSGLLKIAPEHVSPSVLRAMRKVPRDVTVRFIEAYRQKNRELGMKQFLVPYFMSSHPGSGLKEAVELAEFIRDSGMRPEQAQDFTPTPGSVSACMYWTGIDPLTGEDVYVPKDHEERKMQRALLQYWMPENADIVRKALLKAGRPDLIGSGSKCLVRERAGGRRMIK